jgi:3-deoxy-7-phosphoheptulonate synthase
MVIVLKKDITENQKSKLKDFLTARQFRLNEIAGEEETIIAAVGKSGIDLREVEIQQGVSRVVPISKPFKLASREFKKEDTIVQITNNRGQIIKIGGPRIAVISGPAFVESQEQINSIAAAVSACGAVLLRGAAYSASTSPYALEGLKENGLKFLKSAGEKYGLPVVSEITDSALIPVFQNYDIDVYLVGEKNMQNQGLLKNLGKINKPVILRRGLSATLEEFLMSAEYLMSNGCENVILCEQGIRTFEQSVRNTLDLSSIPILHEMTHLPVITDPSHGVGIRDKIPPMALASVSAGADGIMIECNNRLENVDGVQSLLPQMFEKIMHNVEAIAPVISRSVEHIRENISDFSAKKDSESKKKNEKIICVYSGTPGAYAHQAINRYFDSADVEAVAVNSFSQVFQDLVDGKADYGMIPIENTTTGSIYQNYDNIIRFGDIKIAGSQTLNIRHALLGVKGAKISDIKQVYSHPQGLFQCAKYLDGKNWKQIDSVSTATAAKFVAVSGSKENAAIASAVNAQLYGLDVIEEDIQDNSSNFTRFWIITNADKKSNSEIYTVRPTKSTILFKIRNEPGALFSCLEVIAKAGLNMTRLESRPINGENWCYWFFLDVDYSDCDCDLNKILESLKERTEEVRLLGCYA